MTIGVLDFIRLPTMSLVISISWSDVLHSEPFSLELSWSRNTPLEVDAYSKQSLAHLVPVALLTCFVFESLSSPIAFVPTESDVMSRVEQAVLAASTTFPYCRVGSRQVLCLLKVAWMVSSRCPGCLASSARLSTMANRTESVSKIFRTKLSLGWTIWQVRWITEGEVICYIHCTHNYKTTHIQRLCQHCEIKYLEKVQCVKKILFSTPFVFHYTSLHKPLFGTSSLTFLFKLFCLISMKHPIFSCVSFHQEDLLAQRSGSKTWRHRVFEQF